MPSKFCVSQRKILVSVAAAAALATGTVSAVLAPAATAAGAQGTMRAPARSAPDKGGLTGGITHEQNAGVPEGASWTEHYFPAAQADSPTKVTLHADVLRPAGIPSTQKTPVIVAIGPYFNHSGQTDKETDTYQPSSRFDDFIDGAQLMKRGYTMVEVDLRGFGGSTGCLDWLGKGEQADITAAVEWAASQPWSTGKVGTYGKSYDAVTGLWANDLHPRGLKAVVAQEPVWNMYNYLYSNDVARPNNTATPNAYNSIASMGGTAGDSARYKAAAGYEKQHPECLTRNSHDGLDNTSINDSYWRVRDQVKAAVGTTTPIFYTQGFTEGNTKPEDMERYLRNHIGPEHGWMGPWDHVRGNEVDGNGHLQQGRAGFFDEVMRFYDLYLKGVRSSVTDPTYAIQDNFGAWRAQKSWPDVDGFSPVKLNSGSYIDSGPVDEERSGTGLTAAQRRQVLQHGLPAPAVTAPRSGDMDQQVTQTLTARAARRPAALSGAATVPNSYQTWSRPVAVDTRLTGTPRITLSTRGQGSVYVSMWDVDPAARKATIINENVAKLTALGRSFDLKSLDWTLGKGHQLAVTIGTIEGGYWVLDPSGRTVTVRDALLNLAVQSPAGDVATQGSPAAGLATYMRRNTVPSGPAQAGTFSVPTPR